MDNHGTIHPPKGPYSSPLFPWLTSTLPHRDNEFIDRSQTLVFIRPTIFAGFGAVSFAFVCQGSSFLVYRSLRKKSVERWRRVSHWAIMLALVMGIACALSGYLSFVNKTEGNILQNFSADHMAANVARGFLAVTMVSGRRASRTVSRELLKRSFPLVCPDAVDRGGRGATAAAFPFARGSTNGIASGESSASEASRGSASMRAAADDPEHMTLLRL